MTGTILGIDGGGSKTLVALADSYGSVVRMGRGGGINPMDNRRWREELRATVTAFGIEHGSVAGAVAGLPAYGEVAEISEAVREVVAGLLDPVPYDLLNDVDAAHIGAFAGGPGILILAGTGSMAWARDANGKSSRVGGWGEGFGDDGSGHWIGLRAISLASKAADGRLVAPAFFTAMFDALGLDPADPLDSLGGWFTSLPHRRSAVAAVAPLVDRLAASGDPTALMILDEAAAELALHAAAIARGIVDGDALSWSYAGGTFGSRIVLELVAKKLGRPPLPPKLPPIGGALLRAARDLDWPVDDAWIGRLAASIAGHAAAGTKEPHQSQARRTGNA